MSRFNKLNASSCCFRLERMLHVEKYLSRVKLDQLYGLENVGVPGSNLIKDKRGNIAPRPLLGE